MAITSEQRVARRAYIGSSDSAAICGVDEYRSAADVYLSKVGELTDTTNDAMDAGNRLESVVLDWAEQKIGKSLIRGLMHTSGVLAANLDAQGSDMGNPFIVEAKTSGITGPRNQQYDPTVDDDTGLPASVIVQVHHQFFVMGIEYRLAYVPVLIGGIGFRMYTVERNDELANTIGEAGAKFMADHVKRHIPPADSLPSLEVLNRLKRVPNKTIPIADQIVETWVAARDNRLASEKVEKEAERILKTAFDDAEAVTYSGGMVTLFETHRKGFTVQPTTYRQLRLKANEDAAEPRAATPRTPAVAQGPTIRNSIKKKFGIA